MLNRKIAVGLSVPAMALALSATASFADSNEGTVTASALNVRSGPSTSYSVTTKLYKGNKVQILETSNGWHKIKTSSGSTGWVSASYISVSSSGGNTSQPATSTSKATVTADSLNVRSGAGTNYSVITKLSKGTVVDVLESASNGWKKIKTSSGTTGWVSGSYLTSGSTSTGGSTGGSTSTNTTKATVTADSLNVRSGAGTNYSVITKISKGTVVDVLESNSNGWKKIKTSNGTTGWVSGSYLTSGSTSTGGSTGGSTSQTSYKATVTADSLNVRSGAGTSYSIVTKLSKGTVVDVIESNSNGWKKIKTSGGTTGWVSGSYLTNGVVEEPSNPSTNKAQAVVDLAHKQLGKPYVWGSEGPSSFDCSGLTYYVFKNAAGITLPRTSSAQYSAGVAVSKSNLQPGDLIFSSTDGTGNITHVAIYVGDGQMIHAPRSGKNVEKVSISTNYWNNAYVGARRVL